MKKPNTRINNLWGEPDSVDDPRELGRIIGKRFKTNDLTDQDTLLYYDGGTFRDATYWGQFLQGLADEKVMPVVSSVEHVAQDRTDFYVFTDAGRVRNYIEVPDRVLVISGDDCGCCGGNDLSVTNMTIEDFAANFEHDRIGREWLEYVHILEPEDDQRESVPADLLRPITTEASATYTFRDEVQDFQDALKENRPYLVVTDEEWKLNTDPIQGYPTTIKWVPEEGFTMVTTEGRATDFYFDESVPKKKPETIDEIISAAIDEYMKRRIVQNYYGTVSKYREPSGPPTWMSQENITKAMSNAESFFEHLREQITKQTNDKENN